MFSVKNWNLATIWPLRGGFSTDPGLIYPNPPVSRPCGLCVVDCCALVRGELVRVDLNDLQNPKVRYLVSGRLDLFPSHAAQDADEAAYGVRLPAGRLDDLGKGGALGALHHRDHLGFLVDVIVLRLGRWLIGAACLLRGLGFIGRFAPGLGLPPYRAPAC